MSVVRLSRGALPSMRKNKWGRIVNITASSVLQPRARFGLSVATWAGVIGYAKTLSLEVATEGITVNTICPGRIDTPRLDKVFGAGQPGQISAEQIAEMVEADSDAAARHASTTSPDCRLSLLAVGELHHRMRASPSTAGAAPT